MRPGFWAIEGDAVSCDVTISNGVVIDKVIDDHIYWVVN